MELAINNNIYSQALQYANRRGLNLSTVIENFLVQLVSKSESKKKEEPLPDIVLSLMGAGEPVADDDLNARKAYYKHLEEKHK